MFPLALLFVVPSLWTGGVLATPLHYPGPSHQQSTLYFLDNNPNGSSIVAVPFPEYGSGSTIPVLTSTGGLGLLSAPATAGPDSLASQHSVVVSEDLLFTVNAGSNTLAMFIIDPRDPVNPKLVGEPVNTLGDFPVSVTYSAELQTACVFNSGTVNGVACFHVDWHYGLTALDKAPRPVTVVAGVTSPASDVVFSPSSDFLIATVKGHGTVPGFVYAWPVVHGSVATAATVSSFGDVITEFGAVFLGSDNRLLVSDAATGGALLNIEMDLEMTQIADIEITNFTASCWTAYDAELDTGYFVAAGAPELAVVRDEKFVGLIKYNSSLGGAFDSIAAGDRFYALTHTTDILVLDLEADGTEAKEATSIDLSSLGSRAPWQGLAIYRAPSSSYGWKHSA